MPVKGRRSRQQQQIPPEVPPKLPEKKKVPPAPQPMPKYDTIEYEDDEEDYDFENVVDTSKEWQCEFCTYLNSLEKDVCEMCSKSRRSVASTRSSHDEYVSGNSQMDDPEDDQEEVSDEEVEESDHEGEIPCPKCTLYNPEHLNICTVCGASLHKAPIANGKQKIRPQSSASKSSGHSQRR